MSRRPRKRCSSAISVLLAARPTTEPDLLTELCQKSRHTQHTRVYDGGRPCTFKFADLVQGAVATRHPSQLIAKKKKKKKQKLHLSIEPPHEGIGLDPPGGGRMPLPEHNIHTPALAQRRPLASHPGPSARVGPGASVIARPPPRPRAWWPAAARSRPAPTSARGCRAPSTPAPAGPAPARRSTPPWVCAPRPWLG